MSTLDNIQIVYEVLKKAGNIEAQKALMDVKEENLEIREENLTLKDQIKELKQKLRIKEQIEFDAGVCWLKDGNKKEGPFCHICYEKDGKLIHLEDYEDSYLCKVCKTVFSKKLIRKKWPLTSYEANIKR